jgi:hypothetical protein
MVSQHADKGYRCHSSALIAAHGAWTRVTGRLDITLGVALGRFIRRT